MKKAQLNPAYMWDCDQCGTENFERAIVYEPTEEEMAEVMEDYEFDPWESSPWTLMPETVKCKCCGTEYEAFGHEEI